MAAGARGKTLLDDLRGEAGGTTAALFLGDAERIQSWVTHLIACLSRHVAKTPSAELRIVFMIDEADLFMPAGTAKPPSKEPLQDLLRRARAAGHSKRCMPRCGRSRHAVAASFSGSGSPPLVRRRSVGVNRYRAETGSARLVASALSRSCTRRRRHGYAAAPRCVPTCSGPRRAAEGCAAAHGSPADRATIARARRRPAT